MIAKSTRVKCSPMIRLLGCAAVGLILLSGTACSRWRQRRDLTPPFPPPEAAFIRAQILIDDSENAPPEEQREQRDRAKREFLTACEEGEGEVRLKSCNNLIAIRLEDGEIGKAKQIIASIEAEIRRESTRRSLSPFLCNQAFAAEQEGDREAALSTYLEAVSVDGTFELAADAAFRLIRDLPVEQQPEPLWRLISLLIRQDESAEAAEFLRTSLQEASKEPSGVPEDMLRVSATYFTEAQVDTAEFQRAWQPLLENLQYQPSERGNLRVQALVDAFKPDLQVGTNALGITKAPEAASAWDSTDRDRRVFSELLATLGDIRLLEADPQGAARLQVQAWEHDLTNLEAAVSLAATLRTEPQLDPAAKLLDELSRNAPLASEVDRTTETSLRLHAVLGMMYFERAHFGSASQRGSAIFHWEEGIQIYRNLKKRAPNTEPVPVLLENLGSAYERSGSAWKAIPLYLEAVYGYEQLDDPEAASLLLNRIEDVVKHSRATVSADQLEWIRGRREALPRIERKVPVVSSLPSPAVKELDFELDESELDPYDVAKLDEIAQEFRSTGGGIEIQIEGHTDSQGSDSYNESLGLRRAEAVWEYLRSKEVPATRMWVISHGEERKHRKIVEETDAAHKANRRVIVKLVGPEAKTP